MNPQLLVLFIILNVPLFIGLRYAIKAQMFPEVLANQVLILFAVFLCLENGRLYFLATRQKNLNKLTSSLNSNFYINGMAFLYVLYSTIALATATYYPGFPSIAGLFIILFVSQSLILSVSIPMIVDKLLRKFKYGLQDEDTVKDYLKKLSPYKGLLESTPTHHGENRLSPIEIEAIDGVFKRTIQVEIKKELKQMLRPVLLLWSKLFSFFNALILAFLLYQIV